jgi:L-alanine-DL-glutamate epimerase-like enolase superfamily enzyme
MQDTAVRVHRTPFPPMTEGGSTHAVLLLNGHAPLPTRPGLGVEPNDGLKRSAQVAA